MPASWPGTVKSFSTKVNTTEIIDAGHPNSIQDEVVALETALGAENITGGSPLLSTTPSPSGTFTATSTTYGSVALRLANIETGIVSDAHTQYIRKAGDTANVIQPTSGTTKGLVLRANASGQSANLLEVLNVAGSTVASIDALGNITATNFSGGGGGGGNFQAKFTVNTTAKTTNYTLATGDYESMVQINGPYTITVGTGLSAAPVGTQIHLLALTAGVSVLASSVVVNGTPGLKLRAAYSSATLICLGTNNWVLIGDLSA